MQLALSKEDADFREEVRAFIDGNLAPDLREAGNKSTRTYSDLKLALRWHKLLYERGWAAPGWPKEHGGPGWTQIQRYIFQLEVGRARAPRFFNQGIRMVGPVIMRFGTPEQKARYLPRILSGEDLWCQGYSEPGSGSDLASLQTKAVSDGDDYVINGSKMWTTYAHNATSMFALVRTSNAGKPQEGITFVLIEKLRCPQIVVTPIILISGEHEVNQVFLDNVRIPKAHRLGDENKGWTVAKYLLEFERGGDPYTARLVPQLDDVKKLAQARSANVTPLWDDPRFRQRITDLEVQIKALEFQELRLISALSMGQSPGSAASSMIKLRGSEIIQKLTELAVELIGHEAVPFEPEALTPGRNTASIVPEDATTAMPRYLNLRAATIYAGSSEVQRNIIAKAVLGL
jgi:alkylation response protein AidB-like acyl-CoA dehydrogenase